MPSTPHFLYFDLGNVLLTFDHEIACRQMASLAGVSVDRVRQIVFDSDLEWRYERGDIDCEEFYEAFCRESKTRPEIDTLRHAAADIFQANEPVEPIVRRLHREGQPLGILSNTCPAHWQHVRNGQFPILEDTFSVYALSYELRSMKPEPKIYHDAAELAGYDPSDIFFVDDRSENVQAAQEAGYDAVLFTGAEALTTALADRGLPGDNGH